MPALDWVALWDSHTEEEWIVEPILSARRLVALYSPPKVGKSLVMLELAAAVATGRGVLGTRPDRPHDVLYVDFENDPRADVIPRLKAMGYAPEELHRLHYLSFPTMGALDSAAGGAELLAAVDAYGADVVVIDTVSRSVAGEENSNDTWLQWYRHTGKQLKAAGVAAVRLDHAGKDVTKGQRGGSAKVGDVDAVWRLSTVTDGQVFRLECEAHRMPMGQTMLTLTRQTSPHLRHDVETGAVSNGFEARVNALIAQLDAGGLDQSAGRETARGFLKSQGIEFSTDCLAEALRQRKSRPSDLT